MKRRKGAMTGRRALSAILILNLLLFFLASGGCGSASDESYLREVGDLHRKAAENMREAVDFLGEAGGEEEHARRAAAESLQEASKSWKETGNDLSRVRVPAGREDFHYRLLELCASGEEFCRRLAETISGEEEHASHEEGASPAWEGGEAGEQAGTEQPGEEAEEVSHSTDETDGGGGH